MSERQIFEHALELTDPARREQFLSQACGADHELRQRIDALLTSHDELSRFLETPVVQQIQTPSDTSGEATVQLPPRESAAHDDDSDSAQRADLSFLMPSTKPGSIGVLGHYEILQVLGQGAFGIVFKAFDEKLQRHVAIKTMNVQMAATSPPRKRFLREARAAAAIRHDNVTQVYSVEEEPIPYLVMEYIDGLTLHSKLNSVGPLDIPEMLHLGKQIAFGLAAAHEKGLVHRDIKPGNILLEKGAEQKVKITDFGLARAADDASLTQSGLIAGTPLYMAPEQALGQALDARTDLFSFGSVLYQMAAGHPPFRAPTTVAVLRRVVDDTQRPLKEVIPEIPDWFVIIVNKLLSKNPDERYQSAKEVADLLARCQSELQLTGQVTCIPASVRREPDGSATLLTEQPGGSRRPLASGSATEATPEKPYPRIRSWPVVVSVVLVMGIQLVGLMLQTNRTTTLALSIGAMLLSVLLGVGELFSFRKRQREFREGSASALPEKNLTANKVIFALLLGVLVMSPILFGRHLSDRFNAWLWPAIPTLPATELTTGLNFDGKDDYVEFAPVDWSYPQFTIEAFVTSIPRSDNGITVSLTSGGKPWEIMELYDGPHNGSGQRQSGAQIMGKTPIATAYGPLTPGVRQHRALVFDGSHMHYYINGIWQGKRRAEAHQGMMWNLKQLRLGSDGDGKKLFEGRIDQVRISKVARYNENFAPVTSVASDEQTLALYKFDEGKGDVLKDASGHSHDGKIIGATWVKASVSEPAESIEIQSADPLVFDRNRETAEWAHGRGATLVITPGGVVEPAAELPKTPFVVLETLFRGGANVTNLELDPLKRVRHLRGFGISSHQLPEGLLDVLQEQPRLYRLEIESAGMRSSELARSKPWDTVLELQFADSPQNIDDEWRFLECFPSVQRLVVGGVEQLPKLLARLSDLPNLRSLDLLDATTVDEQAVAALQVKNPHLRVITVGKWVGSRVVGRDPVRDAIQALLRQNAKVFGINYARGVPEEITSDNLNDATPWGVNEIQLEPTMRCTEENQKHLASLESGQFLTLIAHRNVDADEWARAISRRRLIHNLVTQGDGLTDAGLAHLHHAIDVPYLSFSDSRVTSAGLERFRRVHPTCTITSDLGKFEPDYTAVPEPISPEQTSTQPTGWPADAPKPAIAPFTTDQAKQHQTAWAKYLGIPAAFTDKHGTQYVLIPPGEFRMGFSQAELDTLTRELKQAGAGEYDLFSASTSGPQHPVRITKPFYMSAREVTVAEYRKFIDETHYMTTAEQLGGQRKKWTEYLAPENPDPHPVLGVSWTDAETYCVLRSKQDGVTYRLPTEAEWEYACRAGTTTLWSFGDNPAQIGEYAVTAPAGASTQPVGSRKPNPLGLFDMYGNAEEWCLDWHTQDFYATCPTDDPVNLKTPTDANSGRVARGGGTVSLPWQLRSSTRRWDFPSTPVNLKGFRVVITGDLKKAATNLAVTGWHGWPADAPPPAIAPFNAEQARQHQEVWAKYLNVPVEYTNSLGMKFRLIPPGEFLMGSTPVEIEASVQLSGNAPDYIEAARSEGPLRKVAITKPFYMGATEVTQRNYERIVSMNPSHFSPSGPGRQEMKDTDTADHPVDSVDWNNAIRFCDLLSSKDVLRPEPVNPNADTAQRYQLPTEAEWEFACRAGTETSYWCGDLGMKIDAVAWTSANSEARTHRVAQKLSNPFGLYDVYGNAFEWTADSWSRSIDVTGKSNVDPVFRTTEEKDKVLRGGCCFETWALCRSGRRFQLNSELTNTFIGFRVALPVDAVRQALKVTGPALPKSEASTPSASTSGEWIDVIPLIDPSADKLDIPQVTGQNGWRKENNELVIPSDERASKLLLPLDSAWSAFECELEFTRRAGSGGFNVNLPTQQGECSVVVDHPSGPGGVFLGARNKGVVLVEGPRIETGKRATLRIELRRGQDADRVSVAVDGTTVGQWSGDRNEIGKESKEGYPVGRRMSLWIHEGGNDFVFHRVRVKMLDGETAKPLRPVPTMTQDAPQPQSPVLSELFTPLLLPQSLAARRAGGP